MNETAVIMIKPLHLLVTFLCLSTAYTQDCTNNDIASCKENTREASSSDACMNQSEFQKLVSSYSSGSNSLLSSSLRGTVDGIISQTDASSFIKSLPDFIEASGYEQNSNGRAYAAPLGYSALGLKELKSSPEAYNTLLRIRERVRSTTEKALNLCPGSLYIDFTTISQKVEGGAHTAHADNCIHYFREDGVAICDTTRVHPYPNRVAASILYLNDPISGDFQGGQFYFANSTNHGEVEDGGIVDVSAGKMMYFTSGVENLHGALPVLKRMQDEKKNVTPKRVVMALWYVFDKNLMESIEDIHAPTEIFAIRLPDTVDKDALLQSLGAYLVAQQNKPITGSWSVNKYGQSALHVLFKDHSAMFSIDFVLEDTSRIVVERHTDVNVRASLQYMLQESVMLHGVLDELLRLLSEGVADNQRLNNFDKDVSSAREKLPARQA
eukprot:scaffold19997_cov84-Cyclotella_meneghiniana.AAC.8